MAKTATPAPTSREVPVNEAVIAEESSAANQLASVMRLQNDLQANYAEDRDLLNQLLGQAQMADAFAKFSVTVTTSKLAFVKEHKLYQALKGRQSGDGHQFSGTWEEFCGLLGRSREQVDEDLRNLKGLGEEALESMSRMGIGYRDLRQYRRLPDDSKAALIEAAKAGDKGELLDLAEELIAKHAKEKADLSQQLEESAKEHEATAKRLEVVTEQKEQAEARAARIAVMKPNEAMATLRTEATTHLSAAQGMVTGQLRAALLALNDAPDDEGKALFMAGMVGQLMADLVALRDEFNLPDVVGDGRPEWQQWADKQAAAGVAAN